MKVFLLGLIAALTAANLAIAGETWLISDPSGLTYQLKDDCRLRDAPYYCQVSYEGAVIYDRESGVSGEISQICHQAPSNANLDCKHWGSVKQIAIEKKQSILINKAKGAYKKGFLTLVDSVMADSMLKSLEELEARVTNLEAK
jgi:hypothetical protein